MSKVSEIIKKYNELLSQKTCSQLVKHLKSMGHIKPHPKKQDMIYKILDLTKNNQVYLERARKLIDQSQRKINKQLSVYQSVKRKQSEAKMLPSYGSIFVDKTKQVLPSKQVSSSQSLSLINFNNSLREIRDLQQKICQNYSQRYFDVNLPQILLNQMSSRQANYYTGLIEEYKIKQESIDKLKVRQVISKKISDQIKGTYIPNRRHYLFNNLTAVYFTSLYPTFLHRLPVNISIQLLYPHSLISRTMHNSTISLAQSLLTKDVTTFNKYISHELERFAEIKKYFKQRGINKNMRAIKLKTITEALDALQFIRELEYSMCDIVRVYITNIKRQANTNQHDIDQGQNKYFDQVNENHLVQVYKKYPQHCIKLLLNQPISLKLLIVQKFLNRISSKVKQQSTVSTPTLLGKPSSWSLALEQGLAPPTTATTSQITQSMWMLNFTMDFLNATFQYENISQQQKQQLQATCIRFVNIWQQCASNMLADSTETLQLLLQSIAKFEDFMSQYTKIAQSTQISIFDTEIYRNIMKQALSGMQGVLQGNLRGFDSAGINKIIQAFQHIFSKQQLPSQVLKVCLTNSLLIIPELSLNTQKSMLKLLGPRSRLPQILSSQIYQLLNSCVNIGLTLEQMLLAIQLAIQYQVQNRDQIILDLILNNFAPPISQTEKNNITETELDQHQRVKKYLQDKIINQIIKKQPIKLMLKDYLSSPQVNV